MTESLTTGRVREDDEEWCCDDGRWWDLVAVVLVVGMSS